jgi:hypothetical protein
MREVSESLSPEPIRESPGSMRVRLQLQIKAEGVSEPLTCEGETIVVNRHGALISTTVRLRVGMKIEIRVIQTDRRALAQVVYVDPDWPRQCGIGFENPQNVWGVSLPPAAWGPLLNE